MSFPKQCQYLLFNMKIRSFVDNFTVLSFLEALEDSVAKSSETSGDNTAGQNDPKSDAMDETR